MQQEGTGRCSWEQRPPYAVSQERHDKEKPCEDDTGFKTGEFQPSNLIMSSTKQQERWQQRKDSGKPQEHENCDPHRMGKCRFTLPKQKDSLSEAGKPFTSWDNLRPIQRASWHHHERRREAAADTNIVTNTGEEQ